MKIKLLLIIVCIILISGCGDRLDDMDTEIAVPVSVEEVKLDTIEEFITTTGSVKAAGEATMNSEIAGYYKKIINSRTGTPFKLGDNVNKNELIIKLTNKEYENNINIKSKKLDMETSSDEYEKQKRLYNKGGVTERELKDAEIAMINSKASYADGRIQLEKLNIIAPFKGVIVDLPYYTSNTKISQGRIMVKFMSYKEMHMEVNLPGKKMAQVEEGQSVLVTNYNLPDDTLKGMVKEVSPAIDPSTRTFKVFLYIDNPDLILKPGMFVKAEVVVARKDSVLVIPMDIILSSQRGKTVYIVRNGIAHRRSISTGLENPDKVEVLSGLEENDRLIIKGFETLRNRSKVKIIR